MADNLMDRDASRTLMGLLENVSEARMREIGMEALHRWRQRTAALPRERDALDQYPPATQSSLQLATPRSPRQPFTFPISPALVPGGFILTAAHCVNWDGAGGMALGDAHPASIRTPTVARFRLDVVAAEPCADIAVLAVLDEQEFGDDYDAFETWQEATAPVPIGDVELAGGYSRGWATNGSTRR